MDCSAVVGNKLKYSAFVDVYGFVCVLGQYA